MAEQAYDAIANLQGNTELSEEGLVAAIANHRAAAGRYAGALADIDSQLTLAAEREKIQALRPDGCVCLGLGGTGLLSPFSRDILFWSRPCDACPEGREILEICDSAAADARIEEAAREEEQRRAAQAARIARSLIPPRIASAGIAWESFDGEPAKADALARMREFSSGKTQPGVLLHGGFGTGKSALSALAIRSWCLSGRAGLFVTSSHYLESLRPQDGRTAPLSTENVDRAATVPLLALDDLGAERLTDWGRDALFRLINGRYDAGRLPTIYTSNYAPGELAVRLASGGDLREGQRLVERIVEGSDILHVGGCNYRHRAVS